MRRITDVHQAAMRALLFISGDRWDAQQRAAECRGIAADKTGFLLRQYRGLLLAKGNIDVPAIESCTRLLTDGACWKMLPPDCKTQQFRTHIFQMLSCFLCLLSEFAEARSKYPFKLFRLLRVPELEEEIKTDKCLYDPWTSNFVEHHAAGGLTSTTALADLRATLLSAPFDTVAIEVSHSRFRRQSVAASCQTHLQALEDASAAELMKSVRHRHRQAGKTTPTDSAVDGPRGDGSKADGGDQQAALPTLDGEGRGQKRRAGVGGPWRAFLPERMKSAGARVDWRENKTLYREAMADPERSAALREAGRLATEAGRAGQYMPFGDSARTLRRRAAKEGMAAQVSRARAGAASSSGGVAGSEEIAIPMSATTSDTMSLHRSSWGEVLTLKSECSIVSAAKKHLETGDTLAEEECAKSPLTGGASMQSASPLLLRQTDHIPSPNGAPQHYDLQWVPTETLQVSKALFAIDTGNAVGRAIHQRLLVAWERLHEVVLPEPSPSFKDYDRFKATDKKERRCAHRGHCICNRSGAGYVLQMENALKSAFNAHFKHDPDGNLKRYLLLGAIVVVFIGRPVDENGKLVNNDLVDSNFILHWAHIGWQWQKP